MTAEGTMKDTQLYELLLGLSKPWSVEKVELGTGEWDGHGAREVREHRVG